MVVYFTRVISQRIGSYVSTGMNAASKKLRKIKIHFLTRNICARDTLKTKLPIGFKKTSL